MRVDPRQRDRAVDYRLAHLAAHVGAGGMIGRQRDRRIEAIDRLHEVKGRAQHRGVALPGDEAGMRHVRSGQRGQHLHLAAHDFVAFGARPARRAPQDVGTAGAIEP